jgi:hypothetical protein
MNWIDVAIFVIGAALCGFYGAEDLWRGFAMQRLAKAFGFSHRRERLPQALSVYGTPFAHLRFTWNVIDGECRKTRVVVFDCQVSEGKENWRRTVIAIKTGSATFDAAQFDPAMKVENSGGWSIVYYPQEMKRGLMPVRQLRAHLKSI